MGGFPVGSMNSLSRAVADEDVRGTAVGWGGQREGIS
jgi:hypothetical protein